MAKRLQLRRGTTTQTNAFTGALSEVTVDTDKDVLVVHDGVTAGGFPVAARANANGTISLIKKDGTVVGLINSAGLFNNTLTSTNADQALTAAQGKVLADTKLDTTSAFGIGQTYQDVTTSRVMGTTYTNTDTKPRFIIVQGLTQNGGIFVTVGGVALPVQNMGNNLVVNICTWFVVPPNQTYKVEGGTLAKWSEMKL